MQELSTITAVILAGGLGKRLRESVSDRSKVMAEISDRPFMTYLLDQLAGEGIKNVVLCTGYMADSISNKVGNSYNGMKITYSKENTPLGTGGALRLAVSTLDLDHILVMNGDSYIDVDLNQFFSWHLINGCLASIVLVRVDNVGRYGKVVFNEKDGRILSFDEKCHGSGVGWINAGIYLLSNEILKYLKKNTSTSLEKNLFPSLIGKGLYGYCSKGNFIDIGTQESLVEAESFFSKIDIHRD
jgi:D-glycero-alpha-D-manno-heptose 1-phosphate guanylyltransferase